MLIANSFYNSTLHVRVIDYYRHDTKQKLQRVLLDNNIYEY